ncbi:polyprenol-phosphate-mannose-dependent alpha-(1-2)-phosphatidylinositol pentamannoside mannosyltransferase [Streptomyces thermoviolaceus subsp. thermoviolaceus]|uniref:glycosyltransferase 87 family protein n=2 Tax=Streptomyces thermoviolaceus TaxID=1952 RepID=UPI001991A6D6|nr:glycosyltransferase 87 family protein [Streptomyces thermoviolaceus]GHA75875.1 polyprenol-phosphate-mannose-dependent alpha-(1-2)-phosphatidylinositol pentamannoside mannosyltransferase [Streptomyces thermoviolaceus subsp. thermoviolaceus]
MRAEGAGAADERRRVEQGTGAASGADPVGAALDRGRRCVAWLTGHAGWVFAGSLALHVLVLAVHPPTPLDLRVYREGAPHVLTGGLYDYALHTKPPIPVLPFTYPPFAALLFLPLSPLPWTVLLALWQMLSIAALVVLAAGALGLLTPRPGGRTRDLALLWAAAGLWTAPVRHTLDQGQVNLLLGAAVLGGLALCRGAAARGTAVGLASSVKLTPAVAGLYLLVTRQWRAAVWAVGTGIATVVLAWCVAPHESVRYWTELVVDTHRVGPVWTMRNQSLRGALTRLLGPDVIASPLWWAALAGVTLAAAWALCSCVRRSDALGALVAVELYGLLMCPISWGHHWIWCVPAMIWLAHGPGRGYTLSRVTLALWALVTVTRLVPRLTGVEDGLSRHDPYPALLAWPGTVYAVCAVLTLLALARAAGGRRRLAVPAAWRPHRAPDRSPLP